VIVAERNLSTGREDSVSNHKNQLAGQEKLLVAEQISSNLVALVVTRVCVRWDRERGMSILDHLVRRLDGSGKQAEARMAARQSDTGAEMMRFLSMIRVQESGAAKPSQFVWATRGSWALQPSLGQARFF
jgi:hypothetical protein